MNTLKVKLKTLYVQHTVHMYGANQFQCPILDEFIQYNFGKTKVTLESKTENGKIKPLVILAHSDDKKARNYLNGHGNYIAQAWSKENQCQHCKEDTLDLGTLPEMPKVYVGIFVRYIKPSSQSTEACHFILYHVTQGSYAFL